MPTFVWLPMTPRKLDAIDAVHLLVDQLDVCGSAAQFASWACAVLPDFLPEDVARSALGARRRWAKPSGSATSSTANGGWFLGCGDRSGLLAGTEARRSGVDLLIGADTPPPRPPIARVRTADHPCRERRC